MLRFQRVPCRPISAGRLSDVFRVALRCTLRSVQTVALVSLRIDISRL
jgi:hypothetical protein